MLLAAALFLGAIPGAPVGAHEARPIALGIIERGETEYQLELRVPASIEPDNHPVVEWPAGCAEVSAMLLRCDRALAGQTVHIRWPLYNPSVTTLARYTRVDGSVLAAVLPPEVDAWAVPSQPSLRDVMRGYFLSGMQHILAGWDHLLFVAGLMLVARGWRRLVMAVSGFTVAHSLTLSLAALGVVRVPIPPTEAVIALSILFLAREGLQPPGNSLVQRHPLLVSAMFGLLHGLGFAAALGEAGLPQREIAWALLSFNLGVEAGQLLFIAAMLGAALFLHRIVLRAVADVPRWRSAGRTGMAYLIGVPAAFWFVQRLPL